MNRKILIQLAHLTKQIACFMTSIVIQFVCLIASFTSLK